MSLPQSKDTGCVAWRGPCAARQAGPLGSCALRRAARRPPAPPARLVLPSPHSVAMCAVQAQATVWGDRKPTPNQVFRMLAAVHPPLSLLRGHRGPCAPSRPPNVSRAVRRGCGSRMTALWVVQLGAASSTSEFPVSGFLWESRPGLRSRFLAGLPPSLLSLPSILTTGLASLEEQKVDWLPQSQKYSMPGLLALSF